MHFLVIFCLIYGVWGSFTLRGGGGGQFFPASSDSRKDEDSLLEYTPMTNSQTGRMEQTLDSDTRNYRALTCY